MRVVFIERMVGKHQRQLADARYACRVVAEQEGMMRVHDIRRKSVDGVVDHAEIGQRNGEVRVIEVVYRRYPQDILFAFRLVIEFRCDDKNTMTASAKLAGEPLQRNGDAADVGNVRVGEHCDFHVGSRESSTEPSSPLAQLGAKPARRISTGGAS